MVSECSQQSSNLKGEGYMNGKRIYLNGVPLETEELTIGSKRTGPEKVVSLRAAVHLLFICQRRAAIVLCVERVRFF